MKINMTIVKLFLAVVVIIGVLFWLTTILTSQSYEGANLTFGVGSGKVTINNASADPINAQLVSDNTSSFRVESTDDAITGSSVRQGTGSNSTQLYEFVLPSGESDFTLVRGNSVNFVADTQTNLQASVKPVSEDTVRNSILFTLVVVVGALFYASYVTEHQWINLLRAKITGNEIQDTTPIAVVDLDENGGQGKAIRSYGDNRADAGS